MAFESQGLDLVIMKPKNLNSLSYADIRTMAWGNNVEHLSMSRHLGKEKVPRVVIKSWDDDGHILKVIEVPSGGPHAKEIAVAKRPSQKAHAIQTIKAAVAKVHAKKPGQPKATTLHREDEYVIIPVHGVTDVAVLQSAGETYRTLIGRGERKVIIKTHDLVDINGKGILDVKNGDPFYVAWQDFNAECFQNPNGTLEARVKWLTDRGYQPVVATALAQSYQRMFYKKTRPLRVREATLEWDSDGGLDIEMELQDFVAVENETADQRMDNVNTIAQAWGFGKVFQ